MCGFLGIAGDKIISGEEFNSALDKLEQVEPEMKVNNHREITKSWF